MIVVKCAYCLQRYVLENPPDCPFCGGSDFSVVREKTPTEPQAGVVLVEAQERSPSISGTYLSSGMSGTYLSSYPSIMPSGNHADPRSLIHAQATAAAGWHGLNQLWPQMSGTADPLEEINRSLLTQSVAALPRVTPNNLPPDLQQQLLDRFEKEVPRISPRPVSDYLIVNLPHGRYRMRMDDAYRFWLEHQHERRAKTHPPPGPDGV